MRRIRFRAHVLGMVALIGITGCENDPAKTHASPFWDRFNHPFDATRLKTIEDASDRLDEFAGGESGFSGQMENNLKTTTELTTLANATRADLDDKLRAYLSTDITWRGLRNQVYVDLGVPVTEVGGAVIDPEYEVSERVQIRQLKLAAVVRALALLGEAQAAVLKRALGDSKKAQDDLAAMQKQVDEAAKKGPITEFPKAPPKPGPLPPGPNAATSPTATSPTATSPTATSPTTTSPTTTSPTATSPTTTSPAAPSADDIRCKRVQWVINLAAAFESAGAEFKKNQALLDTATKLQQKLLATIDDSTDPVSSRALIAVLGTGLSDNDFALLDDYVARLNEQLVGIDPPDGTTPKPPAETDNKAPPAAAAANKDEGFVTEPTLTEDQTWQLLRPSLLETQLLLYIATSANDVRSNLIGTRAETDPLRKLREMSPSVKHPSAKLANSLKELGTSPAQIAQTLDAAKKAVRSFDPYQIKQQKEWYAHKARQDLSEGTTEQPVNEAAPVPAPGNNPANPVAAAPAGPKPVGPVPKQSIALEGRAVTSRQIGGGKVNSYVTSADLPGVKAAVKTAPDDQLVRSFFTTIKGLSASNPVNAENQAKKAGDLNNMVAATSEVETLLDQLNFHSGADALKLSTDRAGIAIDTLDKLSRDQYSVIYDPKQWLKNPNKPPPPTKKPDPNTPAPDPRDLDTDEMWTLDPDSPDRHHPMIETWRIRLFPDEKKNYSAERDAFAGANQSFYTNQMTVIDNTKVLGAAGNAAYDAFKANHDLVRQHPFVGRDDSVVASIRKLADTVRDFHTNDQQANDPLGWNLTRSNIRLQRTVALVNGTMLLLSANEQSARDNATRLEDELSLHSLRLDDFERRTYEAGYRLTLGDIKAFHATGFTDKDLQILGTAALTAIGVRVGN